MRALRVLLHAIYQFIDPYTVRDKGRNKLDEIYQLVSGDISNVDFRIDKFCHKSKKVIRVSNSR